MSKTIHLAVDWHHNESPLGGRSASQIVPDDCTTSAWAYSTTPRRRGARSRLDTRTDLFSFGSVLLQPALILPEDFPGRRPQQLRRMNKLPQLLSGEIFYAPI